LHERENKNVTSIYDEQKAKYRYETKQLTFLALLGILRSKGVTFRRCGSPPRSARQMHAGFIIENGSSEWNCASGMSEKSAGPRTALRSTRDDQV
jgi:hypothetical protein